MPPGPPLTPERWRRIEEIFHAALERPEEERSAFLAAEAGDDAELLAEAAALLREADGDDAPIAGAVAAGLALAMAEKDEEPAPERIGPYRVMEAIGRGGMGTVYAAERDEPFRMSVALKLVRRGLDTADVVARLRQERQILARLEHPGIARLVDGGSTADGRPYFVLERVHGEPIDAWCAHHGPSLQRRLALFLDVCAAVEYAHRSLVIHRDIKPSNVLVTPEGIPKLLDFGLAKLLSPEADGPTLVATRAESRMMTPAYASPEQIRGLPLTTATDVYSLGVLLYRLLTGRHPFPLDGRTATQVESDILDLEPPPPSAAASREAPREAPAMDDPLWRGEEAVRRLRRGLQGDLDAIVLTALRKDPRERYPTAERLAEDLRRYLAGRPVEARRTTLAQRTLRFARRHRVAVAAATLAAVSLLGGTATALWQARQAEAARARAERLLVESEAQRVRAERVTGFLVDLFAVSDPAEARGEAVTAREILDRGSAGIHRELAGEPTVRAALLDTMGQVYHKLGLLPRAEPLLREALDLRRQALGDDNTDTAASRERLGLLLIDRGAYAEATAELRHALTVQRRHFGGEHPEVGRTLNDLGISLYFQGRYPEAGAMLRLALGVRRRALGPRHPDLGKTLNNLAAVWYRQKDTTAAAAAMREALALHRAAYGETHPAVATNLSNLGALLSETGQSAEAETLLRQALAIRRRLHPGAHPDVAETLNNLGRVQLHQGRRDDARESFRAALAQMREALGPDHPNTLAVLVNLGDLEIEAGAFETAESVFQEVLSRRRRTLPAGHKSLAYPLQRIGLARLQRPDRGAAATAEPLLREALAIQRTAWPTDSWQIAEAESLLAGCLLRRAGRAEAVALLRSSLPILRARLGEGAEATRRAVSYQATLTSLGHRR